ncbi:atrial natriuretic peptide receptor 3-like [Tachypleus tridentatus]|uniref:atrial natriuretic peptide receptor 3-like n=1 Tax=Tachypleus tridentatus TaxID=6853 RepID=UPI003FD21DE5
MFFILFGTVFLIKAAHGEETKYTARLVSILVHDAPREPFNYDVVIPAVDLAVSRVRRDYPHITFQATYRKGYTACITHNAGVLAAEEYFTHGVSIFIGPGCSYALDSVARMASYWNIPVCTAAGFDASLNNDKIFSTYMRMMANTVAISRTILAVLKHFLWYHAVVLYDKSMSIGLVTAGAIRADVAKTRYDYMEVKFQTYDEEDVTVNFTTILKSETDKTRVFIIIGTGEAVRKIMLAAYDLGMGNGEFAFLSVELFNNRKSFREFSWFKKGDSRNQEAREIYEALFLIKFRVPTGPEYQQFVRDVIGRSKTKFNKTVRATSVSVTS